jgi:hypothetical protein
VRADYLSELFVLPALHDIAGDSHIALRFDTDSAADVSDGIRNAGFGRW